MCSEGWASSRGWVIDGSSNGCVSMIDCDGVGGMILDDMGSI